MSSSYTTLKGFNSVSDTDLLSAVEQNVIAFFDWGFLDKGSFNTVRVSNTDIRGGNRSILKKVSDPNYTDGQVWSTFHQNLAWESGLSFTEQPVQISGVYVNNAFKTKNTSGYEHYVDYTNGRVVFNTAIPTTSVVKMEYSYKNLLITNADSVPILKEVQYRPFDISSENYNTSTSGEWSRLGRAKVQLPILAVEVTPRTTFKPLELGNTLQTASVDILIHVFAENESMSKRYASFLSYQKDKTIYMYDPDMVARSGCFALDYRGAKTLNPKTYPNLIDGGYRYNKLRFSDCSLEGPYRIENIYHAPVRFTTEIVSIL